MEGAVPGEVHRPRNQAGLQLQVDRTQGVGQPTQRSRTVRGLQGEAELLGRGEQGVVGAGGVRGQIHLRGRKRSPIGGRQQGRDAHLGGPRRGHRPTQIDGPVVLNLDARPLLGMHDRSGCGHQDEQEPKVEWGANGHHRGRKLYVNGKGTVALADCFPGVAGDFTRGRPSGTRGPFRPSRRPGIRPRAGPRGRPLGAGLRAAR